MAALYKTQCPHCAAQFKISDQHLKQAKGAVRCGSCMLVFQADQHLVEIPESNVKPPIRTTGTPATSSWQDIDLSKNIDTGATLSSPSSEPEFSDSFLALSSNEYHASDRKSTRLNSSHVSISYAVFCLKKKKEDS